MGVLAIEEGRCVGAAGSNDRLTYITKCFVCLFVFLLMPGYGIDIWMDAMTTSHGFRFSFLA